MKHDFLLTQRPTHRRMPTERQEHESETRLVIPEAYSEELVPLVNFDSEDTILNQISHTTQPLAFISRNICILLLLVSLLVFLLIILKLILPEIPNYLHRTVILVSVDGFRPDYATRGLTHSLNSLGPVIPMIPVFPTLTFPNHYSLVTGLFPESHGIVANVFLDPNLNKTFHYFDPINNNEAFWWDKAEPIWISVVKQGFRSAAFYWPGSEVENQGVRPTYYKAFNDSTSIMEKFEHTLYWLDLPQRQRPRFICVYIPAIDHFGI
jgi:predicted AlkP superfamily pyrophosphatase or phosphodiesterase